MSIQEKTKQALSQLFPVQESNEQELDSSPEQPEETEKTVKRTPGVIEQDYQVKGYHLDTMVEPELLVQAVKIIFELGYFLESITGVDWPKDDQLEAVYDFSRYDSDLCRVVIRVRISRTAPQLPTITHIFTGANWHERETHDFFGIVFDGHPHLVPLLLPEDADFHPLLKDFSV